jgi:hypothetical protein
VIAGRSSSVATYTEIWIKVLMRIVDPGDIVRDHSEDLNNAPYAVVRGCTVHSSLCRGREVRETSAREDREISVQLATHIQCDDDRWQQTMGDLQNKMGWHRSTQSIH